MPTKKQVVLGWVRSPKHYEFDFGQYHKYYNIVTLEAWQEYRGNGFKVPICDMHTTIFEYTTYYYNL